MKKDLIFRHVALSYGLIFQKLLLALYSQEAVHVCLSQNMLFWWTGTLTINRFKKIFYANPSSWLFVESYFCSGNKKELDILDGFKKDEFRMNMEITDRTSSETDIIPEERIFRVDSSGASVTSGYSISLLHNYCSKLPHDEYVFI